MLGEPPRTQADLNFTLLGIPVRIHPFFWLITLLLGAGGNPEPKAVLIWTAAVLLAILVHEFGHALTARWFGMQPWITLHGFGGLASYQPTRHDTRSRVLITAAGPAAGFLFAAVIFLSLAVTGNQVEIGRGGLLAIGAWYDRLANPVVDLFVLYLLFINIFWGIINLFPVYPLDGGQLTREVLVHFNPYGGVAQSLWLSIITGGLLAIASYMLLGQIYMALLFGYLAYQSYNTLQAYGGGGRRW